MELIHRIKNKLFPALCFLLLCFAAGPFTLAAEAPPLLEPAPAFKNNKVFQNLLKNDPASNSFEIKKIEYLLERLTNSDCIFIRNGENHPGKSAALHMRWKYSRYHHEIKTAKDFVEKIANASRKTREKYKIKMKNGKTYDAVEILNAELQKLDSALAEAKKAPAKQN